MIYIVITMSSVDSNHLLYCVIRTFKELGTGLCKDSDKYMESYSEIFNNDISSPSEKLYYISYATKVVKELLNYLGKPILQFELNTDEKSEIDYDFCVTTKKDKTYYVSFNYKNIKVNNIIPKKLMKICGFNGNATITKDFNSSYDDINEEAFGKFSKYDKFNEIDETKKSKILIEPVRDLVVETIGAKRKCAQALYDYLFEERDRIVIKPYKNRFVIYDFTKDDVETEIKTYTMIQKSDNEIKIKFNNGAKFLLKLNTNAIEIKENISLKFVVDFLNMDDLFLVGKDSVSQ